MVSFSLLTFLVVAGAPPPRMHIVSEEFLDDGKRHLLVYDGHVRLVSDGLAVNADHMTYDEVNEGLTAVGHVVARITQNGLLAIVADVVSLKLSDGQVTDVYLLDGRSTARTGITAEKLLADETPEAIERDSKVATLMEGNHLHRSGNRWTFEQATLVPCDCDFSRPSWSIKAPRATVDPDARRVSAVSPVIRVYEVPILWFPWLSMPMDDRQTGLLMPKPGFVGQNGFSFEQPVFVTLGRSADITFTPGFFTGNMKEPMGVMGPRLNTEFRYALSKRASGQVNLGLLYDFRDKRDPFDAAFRSKFVDKDGVLQDNNDYGAANPRGLRGEFGWKHVQDFDGGWGLRLDLLGHSDGFYFKDLSTDVVANAASHLRSTAFLFQRGVDHLVTAEAVLRQDVSSGYDWLGNAPFRKKDTLAPEHGPGTLQRFPALTASIPLQRVLGPLMVDVSAELTRLAPLFSSTGDEGVLANEGSTTQDGVELPWDSQANRLFGRYGGTGQGNRHWEPGEREARDRATIVPRLHLSGTVLGAVGVSASAWWRQSFWAGEASQRLWQRGALVVDARAETEFGRSFAGGWRHVITPLVAVRAIPLIVRGGAGGSPTAPATVEPIAYDEVDAAIPSGGTARAQAVVELRQRFKKGADGVSLNLGQGVDLLHAGGPSLSEAYGDLEARFGFILLKAQARLAPGYTWVTNNQVALVPARVTRWGVSLGYDDGKHALKVAYDRVLDDGTTRTRAPMDLLFGDPVLPTQNQVQLPSAMARWNFGPVGLSYSVFLADHQWTTQTGTDDQGQPTYQLQAPVLSLQQHMLTVSFTPACDCWRVDFSARQSLGEDADQPKGAHVPALSKLGFGFTFTASRFGSIGVSSR